MPDKEVKAAYGHLSPYLQELRGEQQGALCLTTKGIGAASRKRGFAEGFTLAVGRKGGKERTDG